MREMWQYNSNQLLLRMEQATILTKKSCVLYATIGAQTQFYTRARTKIYAAAVRHN